MTVIITTMVDQNTMFMHCDSIITKKISHSFCYSYPPELTSFGERLEHCPYTKEIYSEKICKIGKFNKKIAVGISGNILLCYEILENIWNEKETILSINNIKNIFNRVKISIDHSESYKITNCSIILSGFFEEGAHTCGINFESNERGIFGLNYKIYGGSFLQAWQISEGSGSEYIKGFFPESALSFIKNERCSNNLKINMILHDYSNYIRNLLNYKVEGVGGAYLGISINENSLNYPSNCIFIISEKDNEINSIVGVKYKSGLFYIMDFISKHLNVMRTIENEINYRISKISENFSKESLNEMMQLDVTARIPRSMGAHLSENLGAN